MVIFLSFEQYVFGCSFVALVAKTNRVDGQKKLSGQHGTWFVWAVFPFVHAVGVPLAHSYYVHLFSYSS